MKIDENQYHSARAMAELDMALRAGSRHAADLHFRLSALHLERMRGSAGDGPSESAGS